MNNNYTKKYSPCLNCGKCGHEQKQCREATKSWGIILVKSNTNINHVVTNIKKNFDGIKINNKDELSVASECMDQIKFLLVRRKHSLGFSEFIRGKYVVGKIVGISGLFSHMIPEEIELIRNSTFDQLWNYFWGVEVPENPNQDIINNIFNKKEYLDSKNKFSMLKSKDLLEHDLDFYLDTANPGYSTPEWGFPKGRKKRGENDFECAIREFCEETEIDESDINILKSNKPIEEELTGTDGKQYKHIYYLAELKKDKEDIINENLKYVNPEIGDIGFFNYHEAINLIRDYHVEKRAILTGIINYYMELLKKETHQEEDIWVVDE